MDVPNFCGDLFSRYFPLCEYANNHENKLLTKLNRFTVNLSRINFILAEEKRFRSCIRTVRTRTFSGADVRGDHDSDDGFP